MTLWSLTDVLEILAARTYNDWDKVGSESQSFLGGAQFGGAAGGLVEQLIDRSACERNEQDEGTQSDTGDTGYVLHELSDSMGDLMPDNPPDQGGSEQPDWSNPWGETQH